MSFMDRLWQYGLRIVSCAAVFALFSMACHGEEQNYIVGTRGGFSFTYGSQHFQQVEAFAGRNLPWRWDYYDWRLQPRAEISAGWLGDGHSDAFIGSLGPMVELSKGSFPLSLEGGVSPTYLSQYHFGEKDFGSELQFSTNVGLNWDIKSHFSVGWRFQHMSNGNLTKPNPSLNLQMLSASFRF
jgi:lipid A 3-O-deacylase